MILPMGSEIEDPSQREEAEPARSEVGGNY